jgi:HAD superfamily hydrolase (TIGR01484 family)
MQPLDSLPIDIRRRIRGVLFDIDDTLTSDGQLSARSYSAMERLHKRRYIVIPITGRPAGWCDHIARMWPVDAVVGENGSFYFRFNRADQRLEKRFSVDDNHRSDNRRRLEALGNLILSKVPGCALASEQQYRESDLAIDYCEDVAPLGVTDVEHIVQLFQQAGANVKVSSIHVNGWFGDYDKLSMTRSLMRECFGVDLDAERERYLFVGDSPNDAPMFAYFPNSIGVANVVDFGERISPQPAYVTKKRCGAGFVEVADSLLADGG